MTSGTTEADKYYKQAEKEQLSELVFSSSSTNGNNQRQPAPGIEDRVLEEIVGNDKLKEMFEKIINQPKIKTYSNFWSKILMIYHPVESDMSTVGFGHVSGLEDSSSSGWNSDVF